MRLLIGELVLPAVIGVATGACVSLLVAGVENGAVDALGSLPGILPALFAPLALLLTWLANKYVTRAESPSTSELYITLYHNGGRVPVQQLPGRVLATTATVGLGGAQGFESTSALIGAAMGDRLGLTAEMKRSLLAAGASAGIAAVFSSPAAGALYGIEVPFKRGIDAKKLIPCVVAAVASFATRVALIGNTRIIEVLGSPIVNERFLLAALLVAVLCGFGARSFAFIQEKLKHLGRSQSHPRRCVIGGGVLILLAIAAHSLTGSWITFDSGYTATSWLQRGTHAAHLILFAFLFRAAANLVTVYGGGGGGVFTSLACNGAFLGEAVAVLLGCDSTHTLALIGAACFLGAGYRLPLALMMFVLEAGLNSGVSMIGLASVAIATTMMGNESVSDTQK